MTLLRVFLPEFSWETWEEEKVVAGEKRETKDCLNMFSKVGIISPAAQDVLEK